MKTTETAEITGVRRDKVQRTGEGFIDVEVTFTLGKETQVLRYGYPLETTRKEIEKDLKAKLATRKAEREQAAKQAEDEAETAEAEKAEKAADKTVNALEGVKVK